MKLALKYLSIFLLAIIVTACSSDNKPELVAQEFVKAGYDGDLDKLLKLLYIDEKQKFDEIDTKELMKSKFKEVIKEAQAISKLHGGLDKIENSSVNYKSNKTEADVESVILFKDGFKADSKLSLIKINDDWLINFY
ncbi:MULTISPECIES: DUF4878 domain-containing protein [unclassified Gilliamella]|uniref:DUF4878 domain-containing protein n=1 Tax=unclassified Gilliamella TaxID=2685620 RepID=UPI001C695FBD|nr:DUF4878 domain-containing protein [Gilliamella sp. ESL0441]QYN44305.1 DUF4878 domain-containing protein [Gilliamella sp. ESL0441]